MHTIETVSRRSFLALLAATPFWSALKAAANHIPVGLELYSVRDALKKDLAATISSVARMGYECVEFYAPYYDWSPEQANTIRRQLDSLKVRCYSTHNDSTSFTPEGINKAIELNQALGARYVVMASAELHTMDDWKRVADILNTANNALAAHGLHAGYHNHDFEWKPVGGQKPIEFLAANTEKSVMLQLDVGTCLEAGNDPVAWIKANPGRIRSMHCKEWSPEKKYRALLGEGVAPWHELFAAAETVGGIEYYLIEQEGSDYSELETAQRCLATFRQLHPS